MWLHLHLDCGASRSVTVAVNWMFDMKFQMQYILNNLGARIATLLQREEDACLACQCCCAGAHAAAGTKASSGVQCAECGCVSCSTRTTPRC